MSRPYVRRISQTAVVACLCAAAALAAALAVEHRTEVTLPAPTGPLPVGRITTVWADDDGRSNLRPQDVKRELLAWIWYPSIVEPAGTATADYLPPGLRAEVARTRGALISQLLTRDLSRVRVHSTDRPEVSASQPSYPVIIFRAGASAEVFNYSTLAEDLASHGYVVVAFDAPLRTNVVVFPDGRVLRRTAANNPELCEREEPAQRDACASRLLTMWTADMSVALDRLQDLNRADATGRFTGRLDTTRVGVFGHSFGGAAAAQFCHDDVRCTAGIDVDGQPFGTVIQDGLRRPFMFVLSDQARATDSETRRILGNIQAIYEGLPTEARHRIVIRGANHFLFSDDGALLKSRMLLRTLRLLGVVGIDGRRQLAVTAFSVRTFFDTYLKGDGASPHAIQSPRYAEIERLD